MKPSFHKFKPLRKEQLVVGVVLQDKNGRTREILSIEGHWYTLSHHNTHFIPGRKWTFNQIEELGNRIVSRPLRKEK